MYIALLRLSLFAFQFLPADNCYVSSVFVPGGGRCAAAEQKIRTPTRGKYCGKLEIFSKIHTKLSIMS